ncbi:hypothetical protein CC86DRAFT_403161 [Ophiobolus disseminans]|uniref:Heterokaryon incompatibility domain-containing protein n=1 Tax=Ophiobolus disseminans TaxID=1469910 RepID=A0A6A7A945_9PLEO|nr:hypothetical protein CC86DRAFT_403161 [Ophiobolus disseminans]
MSPLTERESTPPSVVSTKYKWKPLDRDKREIHLIHLIVIQHSGRVLGRIEHVSLDNPPDYIALSYTWGVLQSEIPLQFSDETPVDITANLCDALNHIFLNELAPVGLPIWTDAVCINQIDDDEKSWQVQQMSDLLQSHPNNHIPGEGVRYV